MKKRIVLIGSTGSVGTQVLDVVKQFPDHFDVVGLAAGKNTTLLQEQVSKFSVSKYFGNGGAAGNCVSLVELVESTQADGVFFASSGIDAYEAFKCAVDLGRKIYLANKEMVVSFGDEIQKLFQGPPCARNNAKLLPVDSELCGLFQCLVGEKPESIRRVILTASGGAVRDIPLSDFSRITADKVLRHPSWNMGKKITVDSATLANKAFEVIEVHYLFGIPYEKIEVRLHRQSRVHAIVEFVDGTSKFVLFEPDMKIPIRYVLAYPGRLDIPRITPSFEFDMPLDFEVVDSLKYPCFSLITDVARKNPRGLRKIVEADDHAVNKFLSGSLNFNDIHSELSSCL
jgi:1-deoxy-D-xylulose-5-phosphate reductoisomerase